MLRKFKHVLKRLTAAAVRVKKRLVSLGAAVVSPFERASAAMTRQLFAGVDRFEGVESLLIRLFLLLAWPLRMLGRLLAAITVALLPRSVPHALAAPFRGIGHVGRRFGQTFMRGAEWLNLDGLVLRLAKWTRPLWYPFAAVGGFLQAWLATRSFHQLLWGLPVILVLLPLAGIGGWTLLRGRQSVAAQYRLALKEAREEKDHDRVALYERKLAQLGVSTQLADFQTALAMAQDGDYAEAYRRMQRLAPADRPGYPAAHFWIAQSLLNRKLQVSDDYRKRLAKVHLDHLKTLGAKGPNVDVLYAIWFWENEQLEEAAKVLEPSVSRSWFAAATRMKIHVSLNKLDDARSDARWVRTHMQQRTSRGDTLLPHDLNDWLIAERLLGDFSKAHALAEQWLKAEPSSSDARAILAELSQRLFDQALAAPDPDGERLAALFVQAAELAENPSRLQQQVAALYRLRQNFPVADEVVTRIVDSPRTTAAILEAIGTVAATAGEFDKAKDYLQRAIKKDYANSIAWNNYAWILLQEPQGDVQAALDAVNKALAIRPDEFRYRETRGQVFVRMGRWQEAVQDLEYAANGMPESRDIHLSLAKAYDALGEKQLAQVHREHAE
jgi:tetratricopeptide (TPR) repeat protein